MARHEFVVGEDDIGRRLDQFLAAQLPQISRARVQELITEGRVEVNGKSEKAALRLREGDDIVLIGDLERPALRAAAENIPLEIVYEDDWLAVVNKPAGMVVHAGAGQSRGTLVNALLHHFGKLSRAGGELRPGIVHRLDKETSGLLLVAKTDSAHRQLAEQFSSRAVKKTYLALVHGWPRPEKGTVQAAISRDRMRRIRMTTRRAAGREATTHFQTQERLDTPWGKLALLEVKIETGRTHQIRVHLASLGHPVVGDTLYGAPRQLRLVAGQRSKATAPQLGRNFLHAASVEFAHPNSGKRLLFSSPLPGELKHFLASVQSAS